MNHDILLIHDDKEPEINLEFDRVIGQAKAIRKLQFYMRTHTPETPVPTMLFTGSHGLGKTYLAEKFAKGMGRRFVEKNCGAIKDTKAFVEGILLGEVIGDTPCTLFLDESHALNSEVTTILLSLLNPNSKMKNEFNYKNWDIVFDMSKINVIFATTDAHMMFGPLLNRCERIHFNSYNHEDLIGMVRMYCNGINIPNVADLVTSVSEACRGRGRDAFKLSQKIKRILGSATELDIGSWNELKELFEIMPLGLTMEELTLLRAIHTHGPISSANLALKLGLNQKNIEVELEPRLRELSLIESTSKGRAVTDDGLDYLSRI